MVKGVVRAGTVMSKMRTNTYLNFYVSMNAVIISRPNTKLN